MLLRRTGCVCGCAWPFPLAPDPRSCSNALRGRPGRPAAPQPSPSHAAAQRRAPSRRIFCSTPLRGAAGFPAAPAALRQAGGVKLHMAACTARQPGALYTAQQYTYTGPLQCTCKPPRSALHPPKHGAFLDMRQRAEPACVPLQRHHPRHVGDLPRRRHSTQTRRGGGLCRRDDHTATPPAAVHHVPRQQLLLGGRARQARARRAWRRQQHAVVRHVRGAGVLRRAGSLVLSAGVCRGQRTRAALR